ncbi:MAG: DUF4197 domain-containing protein [Bacteroidota bacterium]
MRLKSLWAILLALILILTPVRVALGFDWSFLWQPKPDQAKIAAGLKEALKIGTENTVKQAGQVDGFYKNPAIKIPLPEQLLKMEKVLRQLGLGAQVDQFALSLNRAAERATPAAKDIFWGAIKEMTFEDALTIFKGNDTAATDYFQDKTSAKLKTTFLPAVSQATNEADVTRIYKQITFEIGKIKFLKYKPIDIDEYIVIKTLDGLFYILGEEEKKIRQDPAARVTKLLKEVFGS